MIRLKKILLVEDNAQDIELTLHALSEKILANRIVVLSDGVEAMEYLNCEGKYKHRKPENPAFILLDIKMPRMNGLEVLQAIRQNEILKKIPVIMLTSSREEPDLKTCYDLGVNAYVVKPVDFRKFQESVNQLGVFWAVINEIPAN